LLCSSFRWLSTAEWLVKPESSVFRSPLVIPAQAGIQFLLFLFFKSKSFHSPVASGLLSLLVQRK